MTTPYNGWANVLTVQAEDSFNASSSEPIYALVGKTRFTQQPVILGKTSTVDVWRNESKNAAFGKYFQGTIEMEFGFNAVVQMLLSSFFELLSTTTIGEQLGTEDGLGLETEGGDSLETESGAFTQLKFRTPRLQAVKSFKIGLGYGSPGTGGLAYSGVVIDSVIIDIRRNQVPKLTLNYKCAVQTPVGSSDILGTPVIILAKNLSDHTQCSGTLDGNPLTFFTEANFTFTHTKQAARFSSGGVASLFAYDAPPFTMKGQVAEYHNPGSVFPSCVLDQSDHAFYLQLLDPLGTSRALQISFPRVSFVDGTPDGIGKGDLVYRANFTALQDSALNTSAEPNILLVV